jgi:hypothetical protein
MVNLMARVNGKLDGREAHAVIDVGKPDLRVSS